MKQKYYLIAVLFILTRMSSAQTVHGSDNSSKTKFKFLYVIKFPDKASVATENAFVAPSQQDSSYALRSNENDKLSQLLKTDGIIVIKLKPGIKLLTLNDVFDLYHVQSRFWKSRIVIDDEVIEHPETLFISQKEIEKLTVVKSGNFHDIKILLKGYNLLKKSESENEFRKL